MEPSSLHAISTLTHETGLTPWRGDTSAGVAAQGDGFHAPIKELNVRIAGNRARDEIREAVAVNVTGGEIGADVEVDAVGELKFNGADIQTNAANLILDGLGSAVVNGVGNSALSAFVVNSANGSFSVLNGRNFAAATFQNNGTLTVGVGSTFPP